MTWEVIQGDCLDVLPTMAGRGIDAVITDPPYNVNFEYATTSDLRPDYARWCESWFRMCGKLCDGPIVLTCGHANLGMWCRIESPRWLMAWSKPACMGVSPFGFCNWEPMPMWGKAKARTGTDVIVAPIIPDDSMNGHPCPKPLSWARQLVNRLTAEGMTVLDPFCGSGTVGIAAVESGRNFIGIEIDAGYCEIARRRIAEAANHLFAGATS